MGAQPGFAQLGNEEQLQLRLLTDPRGRTEYPASPSANVAIHTGRAVYMSCSRGGRNHSGLGVHGDIDIIPPWTSSVWEPEDVDTALVLGITPSLFRRVAQDLGIDAARVEIRNRFQIRDRQIENIGWALKADMEAGYPGGRIFRESLGTALTAYLLERHSSREGAPLVGHGRSEGRRVKDMLAYIEDHLDRDLSLAELAAVARISPSHCKHIFRQVMGSPLHRYVIERRVERARVLLGNGDLPVSEVALRTGFAHQSHLARHMKRLLGCTPGELARYSRSLLSETALS